VRGTSTALSAGKARDYTARGEMERGEMGEKRNGER